MRPKVASILNRIESAMMDLRNNRIIDAYQTLEGAREQLTSLHIELTKAASEMATTKG